MLLRIPVRRWAFRLRAGSASRARDAARDDWDAGRLLSHPAAPASLTAGLLTLGYAIGAAASMLPPMPPMSVIGIALMAVAMLALLPSDPQPFPTLDERAIGLLRLACVSAAALELVWFGIPLLGHVPYNEFGWPVVHHLAVAPWMLVLFGRQRKLLDLAISLVIAALLFNRQMGMFAVLAYLITTRLPLRRLVLIGAATIALMVFIGGLRNRSLDVDISSVESLSGLSFAGPFFFLYLYLLGPLHVAMGIESEAWDSLGAYWNTIPEWATLSTRFGVAPELSFAVFFGSVALTGLALRRSSSWHLRILGSLIHVYSFFCFFSSVLLSTPIVANYLEAAAAAMFLVTRPRRTA